MGDGGAYVRVKRRTVRTEIPGFMRVTAYKYAYRWTEKDDETGQTISEEWIEDPEERVDVFRRDAVAGVLHLKKPEGDKLLLVRQFRLSTTINPESGDPDFQSDGSLIELMAGVREAGEPLIETFARETKEETGFEVLRDTIEPISSFYPSPGACSERIYLYYAQVAPNADAEKNRKDLGVPGREKITRVDLAPETFLRDAENGALLDAKAIIAAAWLRKNWQRLFNAPPPD